MASDSVLARIERWTLIAGVGVNVFLTGRWTGTTDTKMDQVQSELTVNDQAHKAINEKLDAVAGQVNTLSGKLDGLSGLLRAAAHADDRRAQPFPDDWREAQR